MTVVSKVPLGGPTPQCPEVTGASQGGGQAGHPGPGEQKHGREEQLVEPRSGKEGVAEAHKASLLVGCGLPRSLNLNLLLWVSGNHGKGADSVFSKRFHGGMKDGSEGVKEKAETLEVSQGVEKSVWICKLS